jgi:hypothetical protein
MVNAGDQEPDNAFGAAALNAKLTMTAANFAE